MNNRERQTLCAVNDGVSLAAVEPNGFGSVRDGEVEGGLGLGGVVVRLAVEHREI